MLTLARAGNRALCVAILLGALASAAAAAPLPALDADSLGGKHLHFPDDVKGKVTVLVVAYDQSASDELALWSHKISGKAPAQTQVFAVVDAAGAPFFVHGAIRSGVAKSAPDSQPPHRSNILLTFSGRGWDSIAPAGPKSDVAVVIVDASGSIVFAKRRHYSDEALADALNSLPK